jgi:sec-independent protein translocase protein TatA
MGNIGPTEIILVLLVLVLLFGARKLPELARGSGRALRIFKAETKGLTEDDEETSDETERPQQQPKQSLPPSTSQSPNGTESSDASRATRDQQQS